MFEIPGEILTSSALSDRQAAALMSGKRITRFLHSADSFTSFSNPLV
jgi:hypothetical protein